MESSDRAKRHSLVLPRRTRGLARLKTSVLCGIGWTAWLVLTCLLDTGALQASMVQAMNLAELVEEAELVAVARVIGQRSFYDQRGRIVTDVKMQVEHAEKGDIAPGASVTVRRLGGEIDGVAMRVEGEPGFEDGEVVLLFGRDPRHRAVLRPVGMSQGAMRIFERDGRRWVRSATSDFALVRKAAGKLDADVPAAISEPRPLDDVLGEIQSLVAQAKRRGK